MTIGTEDRLELTDRQKEVLVQIALGKTNRQIADLLKLETWGVDSHIRAIMDKVGTGRRVQLGVYACVGYLPEEDYFRDRWLDE